LNCLSVIQFAVDVLKVRHVIVCGHYGCGGVRAALSGESLGLVDNWLRHVRDVRNKHAAKLLSVNDEALRYDLLCELNVIEQVLNVCQSPIVNDLWKRGQELTVHGWIYGVQDGILRDLNICIRQEQEITAAYATALHNSSGS
jgi:carbonic anhydrase